MLGVLNSSKLDLWTQSLRDEVDDYAALKKEILPDISQVTVDPLTALSAPTAESEKGWNKYYEVRESADCKYIICFPFCILYKCFCFLNFLNLDLI